MIPTTEAIRLPVYDVEEPHPLCPRHTVAMEVWEDMLSRNPKPPEWRCPKCEPEELF